MKSSDKTLSDQRAEQKKPSVHTTRVRQGGAFPIPKASARGSGGAALRSSEEKFRRLFETAQDGILLLDAQTGDITDTNPYIEKLLGYSHRELAGKKLWEIGPFKDAFASREAFRELQRKGYIRYEDLSLETRDGNRCEVEFVSNVYQVRNQKVIQCNVRDITERAHIGHVLQESEVRYRSLFENMLAGFAYCQMLYQRGQPQDFLYLAVNPAFEKLTGLKNVIGKKVTEVIPGIKESDPALFEIYSRVALTGQPEKFEMYVKSLGIWFSISVHSTQKGYFTAVFDNITGRVRAEEAALREDEERYRRIFENITIGLYRTTPEGRILLANPTLIRMLGYDTFEDLAHRDLEKSGFEPQYRRDEFRQQVETKGEIRGLEAAWKKKDGTTIFVRESATAFRNDDGKVLYYEGTVEDVTERQRVEASLQRSQQETAHVNRLLLALSQASETVQRALTTAEVYRAIEDQVTGLNYHITGFELVEDDRSLAIAYLNYKPELVRKAEKMVKLSLRDFLLHPRAGSIFQRVIDKGETVFVKDAAQSIADALPKILRALARPLADLFKLDQCIFTPLTVGEETKGVLSITGPDLSEADCPAITAFARQAAIAMQNARLYEQTQQEIAKRKRSEEALGEERESPPDDDRQSSRPHLRNGCARP